MAREFKILLMKMAEIALGILSAQPTTVVLYSELKLLSKCK